MYSFKILLLIAPFFVFNPEPGDTVIKRESTLHISFKEGREGFTDAQQALIKEVLIQSEHDVRDLLPTLPGEIQIAVEKVDWDLTTVGGVTGRTESNSPPRVSIQISGEFPGGVGQAVKAGLRETAYHELHHLAKGWAIKDNRWEPGIATAAVIEGLAVVFAEEYLGTKFEANHYPAEADAWVREILALPPNANYQHWMFQHPDGRTSIGYRTGNYLVRQAMEHTGSGILELGRLTPGEIIELAGYQ